MFILLIASVCVGILSGILAGLLGLGGGIIIVPALVRLGCSMHVAAGTSLAIVALTSVSAAWSHHKHHSVNWYYWFMLAPGMIIGVIGGTLLGDHLSSVMIRYIFAIFCIVLAINMFFSDKETKKNILVNFPKMLTQLILFLAGLLAGILAGLLGVGGGALIIPILMGLGLTMPMVSGTSVACAFPTAVIGAISSAIAGLHAADLPPYSTGYIYWPAALIIGGISSFAAPVGVMLSHRFSEKVVRKIFGAILILIAWQMAL